jgi:hypothetical protein
MKNNNLFPKQHLIILKNTESQIEFNTGTHCDDFSHNDHEIWSCS